MLATAGMRVVSAAANQAIWSHAQQGGFGPAGTIPGITEAFYELTAALKQVKAGYGTGFVSSGGYSAQFSLIMPGDVAVTLKEWMGQQKTISTIYEAVAGSKLADSSDVPLFAASDDSHNDFLALMKAPAWMVEEKLLGSEDTYILLASVLCPVSKLAPTMIAGGVNAFQAHMATSLAPLGYATAFEAVNEILGGDTVFTNIRSTFRQACLMIRGTGNLNADIVTLTPAASVKAKIYASFGNAPDIDGSSVSWTKYLLQAQSFNKPAQEAAAAIVHAVNAKCPKEFKTGLSLAEAKVDKFTSCAQSGLIANFWSVFFTGAEENILITDITADWALGGAIVNSAGWTSVDVCQDGECL